jgi:hypothetical protein
MPSVVNKNLHSSFSKRGRGRTDLSLFLSFGLHFEYAIFLRDPNKKRFFGNKGNENFPSGMFESLNEEDPIAKLKEASPEGKISYARVQKIVL